MWKVEDRNIHRKTEYTRIECPYGTRLWNILAAISRYVVTFNTMYTLRVTFQAYIVLILDICYFMHE